MNKLRKKTVIGLTLAVSCALSGIAVEAEASEINLSMIGLDGRAAGMGLNTSYRNLPSLGSLGLVAAAPTTKMAKTARLPHSGLVSSFSTNAKASYQTQAAMLPMVAPLSGRPVSSVANAPVVEQSDSPRFYTSRLASMAATASTASTASTAETATLAVPLSKPSIKIAQAPRETLSDQEIRDQLLTTPNPVEAPEIDVLDRRPQPVPSSTFITPNAYGADWGDFYIGSAGATEDTKDGLDGSASVGMGFGNAVDNVGVELNVGIISIDGFADDGTVGFKVHKLFPKANNLGVAVGWYNPIKWGAAQQDEDTFYGVVTQRFELRPQKSNSMPLTTSLGVGTGAFRSNGAIAAGDNAPNLFGSVGLRVIPQVSLVSSWSGRALGVAASAAPFKQLPFVFTAGVSDLTGNTEDGTQFVGGLGYSFGF